MCLLLVLTSIVQYCTINKPINVLLNKPITTTTYHMIMFIFLLIYFNQQWPFLHQLIALLVARLFISENHPFDYGAQSASVVVCCFGLISVVYCLLHQVEFFEELV